MTLTTITWVTAVIMAFFLGGMFTKYFILHCLENDIEVNETYDKDHPTSINAEYTDMKRYTFNYILDNKWKFYISKK